MTATALVITAVSSIIAGVFLCSGAAKIAVPTPLGRAISDLLPGVAPRARFVVRMVGAVEIATALALSLPVGRRAGAGACVGIGLAIVAVGLLGVRHRPATPCGCFGRGNGRPLGWRNVVYGAGFGALGVALLSLDAPSWTDYRELPVLGTAAVTLLFTAWLNRDLVADLGRLRRSQPAARSAG